jgi:CRP-like cAMP-binding protein
MNSETEKMKSFEMVDSHHVIDSLRKTEAFSGVPYHFFLQNAHLFDEQLFAEGTPIFHKNDIGDSLFVILSGSVSIHDNEYTVAVLKEGEIFGEMAFLDPGPRSMSVTAPGGNQVAPRPQGTVK